jgi:hypothetical protein
MDKETFFFTLFIVWYFNRYVPVERLLSLLYKLLINTRDCLEHYNNITNPFYEDEDEETNDTIKKIKYENKYLEELHGLEKEFVFTETEQQLFAEKSNLILKTHKDALQGQLDSLKEELEKIEEKLKRYEGSDDDYTICSDEEDNDLGLTIKERRETLMSEKKNLLEKIESAQNEDITKVIEAAEEEARNFVIKCRLEKLRNSFILEHTPLGNLLMVYDVEKESFKYYSDNSIPYRYLETAARKYVKQLDCRPIYIDMEEELKSAEERMEEEEKKKAQNKVTYNKPNDIKEKKNVFAKFKNYNKESGTGHVIAAGPPKNSIPNNQQQDNDKVLLKEKTNRYTYEGKMANFSFLKKIDRKVVDKKYAMTFADFKKNVLQK